MPERILPFVSVEGLLRFKSPSLRQPVCTVYLQYGDGGKEARNAALLRFAANRRELVRADRPNSAGFFSARRKAGSLHGFRRHSPIHRLLWRAGRSFNRSRAPSAAPAIGAADRYDSAGSRCLARQVVVPPRLPRRWWVRRKPDARGARRNASRCPHAAQCPRASAPARRPSSSNHALERAIALSSAGSTLRDRSSPGCHDDARFHAAPFHFKWHKAR